jgi:molybdenum cofactor cytidylyltransferase
MKMGILLLAAGISRRFNGDKRRARITVDQSLLEYTLASLSDSGLPIRVCLRDEVSDAGWVGVLPGAATLLFCQRSREGMGVTLAQGIAACDDWSATLVALADMPFVRPQTVLHLARHVNENRIVAPRYDGRRGHPVAFGRRYYPGLRALQGDRGAQQLLREHAEAVSWIDVDDPGVLVDVDTPEDLAATGLLRGC